MHTSYTIVMINSYVLSFIATLLSILAFFPYLRDMFRKKTQPHMYTWLIWTITQGTAVGAMIAGGGGVASISFAVATLLVFVVFLFSFRYGTKHVTHSDTVLLCVALLAIVAWVILDSPLVSVVLVTAVDLLGYIPSIRKSYTEPKTETLSTWVLFTVSNFFAIAALSEFNVLTLTYIVAITLGNMAIVGIVFFRRYGKRIV